MKVTEKKETERQQPFFYWLCSVRGIGDKTAKALLGEEKIPEQIYCAEEKTLRKWTEKGILKNNQLENLKESRKTWNVAKEYEKLGKAGIRCYPFYHEEYPEKLLEIYDYPAALFVRGNLPENGKKSVALIGARNCTGYGRRQAEEFASFLAEQDVQIISGMARGIDGIGQRAALEAGGSSFAVLGSGVDFCYPSENRKLYDALWRNGGLLSSYLPGTPPCARNFPPRNRLISGLSDAVLVVEARERSGTWITVDMALEQGREVYALPGRVGDPMSEGCNRLISEGAGIVLSRENFLKSLGLYNKEERYPAKEPEKDKTEGKERIILELLDVYPKGADTIYKEVSKVLKEEISVSEVRQILMKLCLKGMAFQKQGGTFEKSQ